ncbi:hypothetical protein M569_15864 [Genlisea aurea]|uniref:Uncharacterized protein n=1 Tax=Genlisea aurea TaxID=192259 RepID=S8D8E0_9LAMI|nr:hypothetical protein M569_15864 [Genlisea aurea]
MSLTGSSELREAPEAGRGSADDETNTYEIPPCPDLPYPRELPHVYRVHQHLREVNPAAYEPNLIAIGPYHHGKEKTSMMEETKLQYLSSIFRRNDQVSWSELISLVAERRTEVIGTYSERVYISSQKFDTMMVVDACFIIELAFRYRDTDLAGIREPFWFREHDPIFQTDWIIDNVQRDLMVFENQIPFFILRIIYDEIKGSEDSTLSDLLLALFPFPEGRYSYKQRTEREPWRIDNLLDLIHGSLEPPQNDNLNGNCENISSWRLIGSATDLEEANIQFEKQENSSKSLFDIEFADGILRIPTIIIEDQTESFIRNLMAFELYRSWSDPNFITDYVVFLHCLINSSADAKLLQSKGIIMNRLGDNEAVASFLKTITVSITLPVPSNFRYTEIFQEINRFQDRKLNRYMAILRRDYFNSPWTISSFVAAVVLLVITFLSTIFTTMQTFKK